MVSKKLYDKVELLLILNKSRKDIYRELSSYSVKQVDEAIKKCGARYITDFQKSRSLVDDLFKKNDDELIVAQALLKKVLG